MNKHLTAITFGTLGLALALAACGDDTDTLTQAEFTEQANSICIEGDQEIGAAVGAVFSSEEPTPEQMQEGLDTIVSVSNQQLDDIDALAEPSDMSDDVDALIAEGRSATDEAEAQGLGFFETDDDPWTGTQELAADLGLDACAGDAEG